MYELNVYREHELKIYQLIDHEAGSWIKVVPERGSIIIGFGVKGAEMLFLNHETLYNREKNIRGGIPFLFPISGQLQDGEYEWNGKTYKMKNHGVARNLPWEVLETKTGAEEAAITLQLKSSPETRDEFPFDFELEFTYRITKNELIIEQQYRNHSSSPMPMYPGFHPYFKTSIKNLYYQTDATKYLDYNDGQEKEIHGSLDLAGKMESFALLDAKNHEISFELPDRGKNITMRYGGEFKYIILWTELGQDYVCVEPWMALPGELNRKEELVTVHPNEPLNTSLKILVN